MPNGKPIGTLDEVEMLELLYAPRPNLERTVIVKQPTAPPSRWNRYITIGLTILGMCVFIAIERAC